MLTEILLLSILYFIFLWSKAWIKYFNDLDKRFGTSVWRWSYDYPVKGKRNRAVTIMYSIVFLSFIILMSFVSQILLVILT